MKAFSGILIFLYSVVGFAIVPAIANDDALVIAPKRGDLTDQLSKKIFHSLSGADPIEGIGEKPGAATEPAVVKRQAVSPATGASTPSQKTVAKAPVAAKSQAKRQPAAVKMSVKKTVKTSATKPKPTSHQSKRKK